MTEVQAKAFTKPLVGRPYDAPHTWGVGANRYALSFNR